MNYSIIQPCTIINQNVDWSLYPILIGIILAYVIFDVWYFKHVPRHDYKKIKDAWGEPVNDDTAK